jgi:hypothetical protein
MVRVAIPFFNFYKTKLTAKDPNGVSVSPYSLYIPKMEQLSNEFQIPFLNMNDDSSYTCNAFTDASHMASECFPDYTDFIFNHIHKRK